MTGMVTNSATSAVRAVRRLLIVDSSVSFVDLVEEVQRLPNRRPDGVGAVDELLVVADVFVEVREQLVGHFDAYLGHTRGFAREYLRASHRG